MLYALGQGRVLPRAHSWAQSTLVASGAASALLSSAQFVGGVLGSPLIGLLVTGLLGPTAASLRLVIAVSSSVAVLVWAAARRRINAPASPEAVSS